MSKVASPILLITLLAHGSSPIRNLAEEHQIACKNNMKVIVHDKALWQEYRARSEVEHQRKMHQPHPIKSYTLYTSLEKFEVKYGHERIRNRADVAENDIIRDDLFLMKDSVVAAQIVDFIAITRSLNGLTGFTCLPLYKELIVGEENR
ncbi:hypothetical protein ACNFJ7_09160 [Sphingomonas sp. HT-1]|uniref:hypothetical protein n=1 Tax=unclassified Sphingomonas TaxID=196159 RepID=UPI00128F686A|nr:MULTISPECIES: hypothetical protein [unclassified Sphingomonas]